MELPGERGPVSHRLIETLAGRRAVGEPPALRDEPVTSSPDAQLALWILYELAYRGFDGVHDDWEWAPFVVGTRRILERRFEGELRAAVPRWLAGPRGDDVGSDLLELVAQGDGASPASYLQRHASREQVVDFLRERSVQQLKESDPQSFVLPRLTGAAKVALAELQYDEYGAGRPERLHQHLYAVALRGAALDGTYGAYIDEVSALSLACANVMSLFALNRRLRGAAMGHLAAFEASSSVPCRRIVAAIERVGLPEEVALYFREHVEADAVHEQVAARQLCGALVADEPHLREDVLFGAASCLHLDSLSAAELVARWTSQEAAS